MVAEKNLLLAVSLAFLFSSGAVSQLPAGSAHNTAVPKSYTADGKPVKLNKVFSQRLERISKSGVTVFYPSSVPPRFLLSSLKLDESADEKNLDYTLEFCDRKKGLCFSIESASTGIGDGPTGDRTLKGKSKELGQFEIYVFKPGSEGNNTKIIYYLSDWMDNRKSASTKNAKQAGRYYHFLGNGVTDKEALTIVESLTPLK